MGNRRNFFSHLIFLQDIPVKLAQYVIENGLLNKPGWKRFKRYKQHQKQVEHLICQAKLRSYRLCNKYKYDFKVRVTKNTPWNLTNKMTTPFGPMQMYLSMKSYTNMMFLLIKGGIKLLKFHVDTIKSASIPYLM